MATSSLDKDLVVMGDFLRDQKAEDIFQHKFSDASVCDAVLIATATSRRHAQGLADGILRICTDLHREFLGMEGYDGGQWILVDCNDVIVHIFQSDLRQLYRLEDLCVELEKPVSDSKEVRL